MQTNSKILVALSVGLAVGVLASKALQAQAKPVGYIVSEIEVTDQDGFSKEFVPLVTRALVDAGAKSLARGGKTAAIFGDAPKGRVVLWQYETFEKAQAAYKTDAFIAAKKIGDKYAKFRIFAVEGIAPQ